jgi:hypothetical protein
MSDDSLTREQALLLLHDHLGERIYFGLRVNVDATDDMPGGSHPVIELHGELTHPVEGGVELAEASVPDTTREIFGYVYKVGEQPVCLPPLPGTIAYHGHGLDFELTDGLTLRVAWQTGDGTDDTLTHEQALMLLADHMGENVSVWLTMTEVGGRFWSVLPPLTGTLGKTTLGMSEGEIDPDTVTQAKQSLDPMYTVGEQTLMLPRLPGTVQRYEMGLQWLLANGLTLRINWGGEA